ncbi:hypothetical protein OVA14_07210 [Agrococcus sp. SL85]|uniref:hypothetical protein n=1 Tax=Agrococcus sp. SL85 TaxID=2995141 RepID=UPI00226C6550|nr:hypothetical protein [Agrococcus sp. SL85]WAC65181.1 hypothetical protein OVA14_07210 [Agrococcus sp. SL85]
MAGSVIRIRLNRDAVIALLNSAEVRADLDRRAQAMQQAAQASADAGAEFAVVHTTMRDRAAVRVVTNNYEARAAEAERGDLTRAIDAGRG